MDAHPTASPASAYRDQVLLLRGQVSELELQMVLVREDLVREMTAAGWKQFEYYSSYYGSHGESGGGDREVSFLFHPSVDVSVWSESSFSHGYFSQSENNNRFEKWLAEIPQAHVIEL